MNIRGLDPFRVVELTRDVAGAFCGREFALWGANVQRFQLASEGRPHAWSPAIDGPAGGISALWEFLDSGKQRHMVPAGDLPRRLRDILPATDVVITDWSPAELRDAGLEVDALRADYPRLVVVMLRPFGLEGPYIDWQGTDLLVQALSGFMSMNGEPAGPPLKAPANVVACTWGVNGFVAALAALWERRSSGAGQAIEVSGVESAASFVRFLRTEYIGWPEPRHGGAGPPPFRCADGYITANVASPDLWEKVLAALGGDVAAARARIAGPCGEPVPERVRETMREHLLTQSARHVFEVCNALQISAGLVVSPPQLLDDPHLASRQYFERRPHPSLGEVIVPGRPSRVQLSPSPAPVEPPAPRTAESAPPLAGIRVLDFTQAWMGPFASMMLGDLGADVIKVESPRRPDVWRMLSSSTAPEGEPHWPTPANPSAHPWNTNHLFNATNRNKRAITLDLANAQARAAFERLVTSVDLMVTNYTPRVLENFGFTPERLWELNPSLVVVDVSGYGRVGPYRNFKANGATIEACSGWMSLFAPAGAPPFALGSWQSDAFCGLRMAAFALVGLLARDHDRHGRYFGTSMQEIAVDYIGEEILNASAGGTTPLARGNRHLDFAPHGAFPTTGSDRWIAIAIRDDTDWEAFLACAPAAGRLRQPEFATAAGRRANVDALETAIAGWTRDHDRDQLAALLQAGGVPAAAVLEPDEVLRDPSFVLREWFQPIRHPDLGEHRYNGFPWRFSRTPARVAYPPPRLGEHSEEIIVTELGFSAGEYRGLVEAGASGPLFARTD